jgi:hypothetical protein
MRTDLSTPHVVLPGSHAVVKPLTASLSYDCGPLRVDVYDDLTLLPRDVAAFITENVGNSLCLSTLWMETLLRHSPAVGKKPHIYVVTRTSGMVECVVFGERPLEIGRPHKLQSLTNFYTMSYAPVLRRDLLDSQTVLDALATYIVRERPRWDIVELHRLVLEDATTAQLKKAFRQAGMLADTFAEFENWFYPSDGVSADDYFKTRPPPVRAVARKMRQAQKKHEVTFQLYQSLEGLDIGIADYEKVYANSWKDPETFPEFIPQLLRRFAAHGNLRLGVLCLDGTPAAAQIWLLSGRRATIYKVAYDEKFAPLSAGSLLSKLIFDHVLDQDKVGEIDYGVGSERYKLDWMSECRHIVGLICFNPRSVAGLREAARHFGGRLRHRFSAA